MMESRDRQAHWEGLYTRKGENEVSRFQDNPAPSLQLIAAVGAKPTTAIIDIGGGASRLVDSLLAKGFRALAVLDLSGVRIGSCQWPPYPSRISVSSSLLAATMIQKF